MKNKQSKYITLFIGFLIAFVISTSIYLFIILDWTQKAVEIFAMVLGISLLLFAFLTALFFINKNRIFEFFKIKVAENVDEVQNEFSKSLESAVEKDYSKSIYHFSNFSKSIVGWFIWKELRVWIFGSLIALFGAFVTITGSAVLIEQNKLISKQNISFERINQPKFDFTGEVFENDEKCEQVIKVNISGEAYNKWFHKITILEWDLDYKDGKKQILFPAYNRIKQNESKTDDFIYTIDCYQKSQPLIQEKFSNFLSSKSNLGYLVSNENGIQSRKYSNHITIHSYLGMTYNDVFGKRNTVLYQIEPRFNQGIKSNVLIDENTSSSIISFYSEIDREKIDFYNITDEDLNQIFEKLISKKAYAEYDAKSYSTKTLAERLRDD